MPIQMIFGHEYFISEPIFKLFVALFRTHELQKDGMVIFFRKVRFRKMQCLKDGVQTVGPFYTPPLKKSAGYYVIPSKKICVRVSVHPSVCPSVSVSFPGSILSIH